MNRDLTIYTPENKPSKNDKQAIVNFLYQHLEQYRDDEAEIIKAVDYAMQENHSFGGKILTTKDNDQIIGVVVLNKTGMKGYIPENILVYIAVHKEYRGRKIGKYLLTRAIELTEGDLALHVEPDNPAKFLYEKVGFANKYLEMRYKKGEK